MKSIALILTGWAVGTMLYHLLGVDVSVRSGLLASGIVILTLISGVIIGSGK